MITNALTIYATADQPVMPNIAATTVAMPMTRIWLRSLAAVVIQAAVNSEISRKRKASFIVNLAFLLIETSTLNEKGTLSLEITTS